MKQKRTFVTLVLIIAILCLGIAYASVLDIDLLINGTATATPDAANFVVHFSKDVEAEVATLFNDNITATSEYNENYEVVTLTCANFAAASDAVTVTYTVENNSPELMAYIAGSFEDASDDLFTVNAVWLDADDNEIDLATAQEVDAGGISRLAVTVSLDETVTEEVTGSFTVSLTASPDAPAGN